MAEPSSLKSEKCLFKLLLVIGELIKFLNKVGLLGFEESLEGPMLRLALQFATCITKSIIDIEIKPALIDKIQT